MVFGFNAAVASIVVQEMRVPSPAHSPGRMSASTHKCQCRNPFDSPGGDHGGHQLFMDRQECRSLPGRQHLGAEWDVSEASPELAGRGEMVRRQPGTPKHILPTRQGGGVLRSRDPPCARRQGRDAEDWPGICPPGACRLMGKPDITQTVRK